jgi:hypothetical protein
MNDVYRREDSKAFVDEAKEMQKSERIASRDGGEKRKKNALIES